MCPFSTVVTNFVTARNRTRDLLSFFPSSFHVRNSMFACNLDLGQYPFKELLILASQGVCVWTPKKSQPHCDSNQVIWCKDKYLRYLLDIGDAGTLSIFGTHCRCRGVQCRIDNIPISRICKVRHFDISPF